MCGRFTLTTPAEIVAETFGVAAGAPLGELQPRYNIAPSQPVAAIRRADNGARDLVMLRWGLVPSWAKDPTIGNRLINARGETVAEKPSFRSAFAKRRCLIAADGFYEWQARGKGETKRPYHVRMQSRRPFALAGLWERWDKAGGDQAPIESCTIVTTAANELMAPIHARMPVIVRAESYDAWLAPGTDRDAIEGLLAPYDGDELVAVAVSTHVNRPANDDPTCLEPADDDRLI